MQTQTTDMIEHETTAKGPGSLLTDTRLKLGLDPKNVAEMLHLREHQIRALEEDDYDNLPEPTYVKGYLRAYAQLLSLEPDMVIKLYTDYVTPPAPVRESFEGIAPEKQAASNDNLVKLVSVALVVLVAGLAIVFWSGNNDVEEAQPTVEASAPYSAPQETTTTATPDASIETATQPTQGEAAPEKQSASAPQPVETAKPAPTPVARPAEPVQQPAQPAEQQPVEPAAVVAPGQQTSAGIKQEASLLPATDNEIRTALVFKVVATSWVDIRDARGNKLIYETVPAGREIPLEGLAPFSVFLGNADGVEVQVEGKPFDFSGSKRGLTARFKIARPAGTQ